MDNGEYRALITTREKINSNTLYVLRIEVLPMKKRHTLLATQQKAVGSQLVSVPSDVSISELINGVNIYDYDLQKVNTYLDADIQFSLKGSTLTSESIGDILDIVGDMQTGKKGSAQKLSKYVDNGLISTEKYEQLIERYGAIPKGESPHREVHVPRKTADDKKVSQTVRTILEANVTPDEAVPTIEKMVEDGGLIVYHRRKKCEVLRIFPIHIPV